MATPFSSSPTHNQGVNECRGSGSDTSPPALPILPNEIIVEILSRLPAKTLIKFRCVCKSFETLISCPKFIKTHLRNVKTWSKTNPSDFSERLVTKTKAKKTTFQSWSIHSVFSSPEADVMELDCAYLNPDSIGWRLVGSCDGLLCLDFDVTDVILWNPTTRVINILPSLIEDSETVINHLGFGYDSEMDDYVVVAMLAYITNTRGGGRRCQYRVKVYTLKTQCWKCIEDFEYECLYGLAAHVKGNICWMVKSEYSYEARCAIVALDLAKQTFKKVLQPDYEEGGYGKGEVLLDFAGSFVIYNPNFGTFRYPKINHSYVNNVYVESLVSPVGGTTTTLANKMSKLLST